MTRPSGQRVTALDWLAVVLIALCGVLAGLLELLLVPLYAGSVLVPVAIVFALASNVALPWLARSVVPRTSAALAPFAGWLLVVIGFGFIGRPEGDVILPGAPTGPEIVGFAVTLGGAVIGTITIVWLSPPPGPRSGSQTDSRTGRRTASR